MVARPPVPSPPQSPLRPQQRLRLASRSTHAWGRWCSLPAQEHIANSGDITFEQWLEITARCAHVSWSAWAARRRAAAGGGALDGTEPKPFGAVRFALPPCTGHAPCRERRGMVHGLGFTPRCSCAAALSLGWLGGSADIGWRGAGVQEQVPHGALWAAGGGAGPALGSGAREAHFLAAAARTAAQGGGRWDGGGGGKRGGNMASAALVAGKHAISATAQGMAGAVAIGNGQSRSCPLVRYVLCTQGWWSPTVRHTYSPPPPLPCFTTHQRRPDTYLPTPSSADAHAASESEKEDNGCLPRPPNPPTTAYQLSPCRGLRDGRQQSANPHATNNAIHAISWVKKISSARQNLFA